MQQQHREHVDCSCDAIQAKQISVNNVVQLLNSVKAKPIQQCCQSFTVAIFKKCTFDQHLKYLEIDPDTSILKRLMHHQSILKLLWFSKQKLQETMHLYISNYVRVFKNKIRVSISLWRKQQQSHKFPPWRQYFALFWYFSTVNGNLISSSMKTKTTSYMAKLFCYISTFIRAIPLYS